MWFHGGWIGETALRILGPSQAVVTPTMMVLRLARDLQFPETCPAFEKKTRVFYTRGR